MDAPEDSPALDDDQELFPPPPADPAAPPGKVYKQPTRIACLGCRGIKVKCRLPNGEIPTGKWEKDLSKCTRCIRLKIPCEYKSAPRRGRKPKDRTLLAQQEAGPPLIHSVHGDHGDDTAMLPLPPVGVAADPTAPFYFTPSLPSTSTAPPQPISQPPTSAWPGQPSMLSPHMGYSPQQGSSYLPSLASQPIGLRPPIYPPPPAPPGTLSQGAQSSPAAQSVPSAPSLSQPSPASVISASGQSSFPQAHFGEHASLSLAEAAETRVSTFKGGSKLSLFAPKVPKVPAKQPDPVDLGVLSMLEASQLIQLFHTNLNPYIILLDRHYHTPERVRTTSTVLFTAMLAVSSKFFRQDLYQPLLLSSQQLITRHMGGDGTPHIGLIQAILISVYWKEPFDSSAWLKVGYAIRLGYQLGIHHKRRGPLPPDVLEARMQLDGERTWITLVCFDHSYILSDDFDETHETRMVTQHDIDIDAWLAETRPYDVPDDNEQGASIELIRVWRLCKNIVNATSPAAANTLANHLSAMLMETYRKYLDANSPCYRVLVPQAAHKVRYHWRAASVSLGRACLIAAGVQNQLVLADFLARAAEMVECFEELVNEGLLRFLQDLVAMTMLAFGEFLGKLFAQVDQMVQTTIVKFLTQVYTAAARVKDNNEDSVAGFIARFYRAVLRALRGPGMLPETRPSSPKPGGVGEVSVNPFEQLGGMENELFTDLDSLVAELNRDNSYWDSINSAQTNSSWAWLDQALLQPQDPPHPQIDPQPPTAPPPQPPTS
ncbi:hypothetical protein JCM8097_004982 [Rhodosporidiobolus ruineniae]